MNEDEYFRDAPGDSNLKAINDGIAWEEAGASEFIKSEVVPDTAGVKNRLTFRIIQSRPKPLTIVNKDDPQPPGTKEVWSGGMVVEEKITAVTAYRTV